MSWDVWFAALSSFVLLAVAFVPLERVFPARAAQPVLRPGWRLDLVFFVGQYVVWNLVAIVLLTWLARALSGWLEGGALRVSVASWPSWLQGVAAVVLGDVLVYWFHRACHTFGPLWRIHSIHHSAESLDWLAAHREHPFDGLLTQLCANLPAMWMGFDVLQLSALAAFRGMWSIFIHSNVRLPLGPLKWLFGAPELHHWHHARDERMNHNYANTAPWLDVVFGTHHDPGRDAVFTLGVAEPLPRSYLGQLWHPVRCFTVAATDKARQWARRSQRRIRS